MTAPPSMKAIVSITFREGVLDPEAAAIARSLQGLGFDAVRNVRRVRRIELDLATADAGEAERMARAMCDALLANPVIETYRFELTEA